MNLLRLLLTLARHGTVTGKWVSRIDFLIGTGKTYIGNAGFSYADEKQ